MTVFIGNTSSVILQSNFFYLFPFGLVLEKFAVWFKHGTLMQTMIGELNETYQLEVMAT